MKNIFITGATGFLGSELMKKLASKQDNHIYILIRGGDDKSALRHARAFIYKVFPKMDQQPIVRRIYIVRGDIAKSRIGLNKKDFDRLQSLINVIYHCAALRELNYDYTVLRRVNVIGTKNLLDTALCWRKRGPLENVNHISTAYIAGNYEGILYEDQADISQDFNNPYEKSKFQAEELVFEYRRKGLPVDIYRPSIIVDNFPKNREAISGASLLLSRVIPLFKLGIFKKWPADGNVKLNLIPVDTAAEAIYLISTTKNRPLNQTYHIVNPNAVKLKAILDITSSVCGFKRPRLIPSAKFPMAELSSVQKRIIKTFIPYMNQYLSFDIHNALDVLEGYNFKIPRINRELLLKALLHYKRLGLFPTKE